MTVFYLKRFSLNELKVARAGADRSYPGLSDVFKITATTTSIPSERLNVALRFRPIVRVSE